MSVQNNPLISIVVPVYNVAAYLPRCLDSMLAQTYQTIEIILVNDGSTDTSGSICREYQKKDSRIIFIEQKNQGLSAARNAGMEKASGEYIGFVDSDDWIAPTMFEELLAAIVQNASDVSVCGYYFAYPSGRLQQQHVPPKVCMGKEAVVDTLKGTLKDYAWNKLYRRELFRGIQYPVGKTFEDIATTYRVLEKAERVTLIDQPLYYYVQRKNSITNAGSLPNAMDRCNALYQRAMACKAVYPEAMAGLAVQVFGSLIPVFSLLSKYKKVDQDKYVGLLAPQVRFVREHRRMILENYSGKLGKFKMRCILSGSKIRMVLLGCLYHAGSIYRSLKTNS